MERAAVVVESVSTSDVAPEERTEYWSELVSSYHRRMDFGFDRQGDFHGRTARRRTGAYQLVGWQSDAVTYRRTPGHVRADSDPDYRLLLVAEGQVTLRGHADPITVRPGAGCVMTMDTPFVFGQNHGTRALVLTVPRAEFDRCGMGSAPAVHSVDLTVGLGRVVGDLVAGLFRERCHLTHRQFDAVAQRAVELLCLLVTGDDRPTAPGHLTEVESAIRQYVRANAGAPDLNGTTIAHALGWSLRQIQLVLHHAGTTPRELIREERLQLAHTRLRHPAYAHRPISDLAHDVGFRSASAFSTAFRDRFGVSPREVRTDPSESGRE
ncbi:AraC family transcriptional regulator [Nocardia puris]|uniref:AraC family transcriptional regulator n=1 Tax=Nocardia puris TaxID=208602 RepID=A0A366DV62_9NOCA|nr:AraC family transcriptional regulator [Nocardia puris]